MNRPNDPKAIHESILKDIMDLWDGAKEIFDKKREEKKEKDQKRPMGAASSIAKLSSNLTLVFPVICSRGISVEKAGMISKAVEKNAASMLQKVFAAWQIADSRDVKSFQDYINQFHSNLSTRVATLDDVFELASRADNSLNESTSEASLDYEYTKAVREDMKNLDYYLPSAINETSLNQFMVKEGAVKQQFRSEVNGSENEPGEPGKGDKVGIGLGFKDSKSSTEYFKNQIPDVEYKKANELMPTPMIVNIRYQKYNGEKGKMVPNGVSDIVSAMIGVKAKLYPIGSEDIVKHVAEKSKDSNWITNFFRATTREISFMKDFVLAIDKAKIDAMSLSTRQSSSDKMWKVLERRATVSRLKKAMRANNAGAITTLCVSQEEVEVLRKEHNVDLERISTVLGLFESYNLMCICIVDESLEVAKFIFDENEPSWETISFTHLERESSDNTYKRVVNLMTKMR